jgi:hypothetical protein
MFLFCQVDNFESPCETTDFIAGKIASIVASTEHEELGMAHPPFQAFVIRIL